MSIGSHQRLVPPDSTSTARCECVMTGPSWPMMVTITGCPLHDPNGYAAYQARHCPDSIVPSDRYPWSRLR